jgi:hypothetical protein
MTSYTSCGSDWIREMRKVQATCRPDLSEDVILRMFAEIMIEWGHYRTAEGLRYPTAEEIRGTRKTRAARRGSVSGYLTSDPA